MALDSKQTNNVVSELLKSSEISLPLASVAQFKELEETLLEPMQRFKLTQTIKGLKTPSKYTESIKYIIPKLFVTNLMSLVFWAKVAPNFGEEFIILKGSKVQEIVYNVLKDKYNNVNDSELDGKFSQYFRSFRLHH